MHFSGRMIKSVIWFIVTVYNRNTLADVKDDIG